MPGTSRKPTRPSRPASATASQPVAGTKDFETSLDTLVETFSIFEGSIRVTYHLRKPVKVGWEHHNSGSLNSVSLSSENLPSESFASKNVASVASARDASIAAPAATVEQLFAMVSPLFDGLDVHFGEVLLLISRGAVRNMQVMRNYRRDEFHTALPRAKGNELVTNQTK